MLNDAIYVGNEALGQDVPDLGFLQVVFALLDGYANPAPFINQLKHTILQKSEKLVGWIYQPVLEHLKTGLQSHARLAEWVEDRALARHDACMAWSMVPVIEHLRSDLRQQDFEFLLALARALNDSGEVSKLNKYAAW